MEVDLSNPQQVITHHTDGQQSSTRTITSTGSTQPTTDLSPIFAQYRTFDQTYLFALENGRVMLRAYDTQSKLIGEQDITDNLPQLQRAFHAEAQDITSFVTDMLMNGSRPSLEVVEGLTLSDEVVELTMTALWVIFYLCHHCPDITKEQFKGWIVALEISIGIDVVVHL